jgi:hypothetical protein
MCKIITLSQLKAAGACANALQCFAAAFGESVQVTPSLAGKYADQFSWDWAADNLLPAPARAAYDRATERAWAEYETAAAPARVKYAAATAAARVKYAAAAAPALALLNSPPSEQDGVARAHLWAKYDRDRERAQVEYDRAAAAALAEYDRTCARAWAHLYIKEGI